MKILYVANVRMPTEKAHGAQIAKTCEAFVKVGASVELVIPNRRTHITETTEEYYGLTHSFPISRVRVLDYVSLGRVGFLIETLTYILSLIRFLHNHSGVVYGRDEFVLYVLARMGYRVVWESHTGAWNFAARYLVKKAPFTIVISEGLKKFYSGNGIDSSRLFVAHDGAELRDSKETKEQARTRLGLPLHEKVALYIGRIDMWKGVDTICAAAPKLHPVHVAIIGGEESQIALARAQYSDVLFLGARPYREVFENQAAADVLVLPNTGKDRVSVEFTSPLKLFTYMASGVPIVASDLPSLREILDDRSAYWFRPDDADDLARVTREALQDPLSYERARVARSLVQGYTWEARARRILSHLNSL